MRSWLAGVALLVLAACGEDVDDASGAPGDGAPISWAGDADVPAPIAEDTPPSLPSLTVNGQPQGISLASMAIDVKVYGRLARTEVTQVFQSHLGWQSEGTYEFTMPEGAVLSRLAMDVEGQMMEGELVEKEKARQVYESIVHARKDPALLEWQGANRFKMQVFPIPGNGTKTIILAYEQVLPVQGRSVAYTYALPTLARDAAKVGRASTIGRFSFRMSAASASAPVVEGYRSTAQPRDDGGDVVIDEKDFVPAGPLRVSFARPTPGAPVVLQSGKDGVRTFFVDLVPDLPAAKGFAARDIVVAIDTSRGIGGKELARVVDVTRALLQGRPENRVRVVHGDMHARRCVSETGPLEACLGKLNAGGATNLEELLRLAADAAAELDDPAIVLFSDGLATVGELDGDVLAARFFQHLAQKKTSARVLPVAVGHAPDMDFLQSMASTGRGRLVRMTPASTVGGIRETLEHALRAPVLTDVTVSVKDGDVTSLSVLPSFQAANVATSLRPGEPLALVGRAAGTGDVVLELHGTWGGDDLERTIRVKLLDDKTAATMPDAPIVTRFWARGHIAALEASGTPREQIVTTSQTYGVMSRATSFLVLENDEAYKRFQIERRQNAAREDEVAALEAKNLVKSTESLQARLAAPASDPGGSFGDSSTKKESAREPSKDDSAPRPQAVAPPPPPRDLLDALGGVEGLDSAKLGALSADSGTRGGGGTFEGLAAAKSAPRRDRRDGGANGRDVSMMQGTPVILGSLDKELVRRVVKEHMSRIRFCYESELVRTPGISGKIKMKWVINGEGRVTQAQVEETQMNNANVENCLATKIKTWRFPKPRGGGIVIVSYPFIFRGGDMYADEWDPRRVLEARLKSGDIDPPERAQLIGIYIDANEGKKADQLYAASKSRLSSTPPADARRVLMMLSRRPALAKDLLDTWRADWLVDEIALFDVVQSSANVGELGVDVGRLARRVAREGSNTVAAFGLASMNLPRPEYLALVDEVCRAEMNAWRGCQSIAPSVAGELPGLVQFLEGRRLEAVRMQRRDDVANRNLILEEVGLLDQAGDANGALRVLSEIVESDPHDANVRLEYASLLNGRGELRDACEAYGHTAQLDPSRRDMYRAMMALHRTNPKVDVEECIVNGVSRLPVQRALSIVLTWEDDAADIDLHVESPSGEEVFFQHKNGSDGGLLYYDVTDGYGPEVYTLGQAEKGTYKISVVYYAGKAEDVKATVTILENAGTPAETRRVVPVVLDEPDMRDGTHVAYVRP